MKCNETCGCGAQCEEGAPENHRIVGGQPLHACSVHWPRAKQKTGPGVELRASRTFEAAHHLPCLPDGHPCRRLHGHRYAVEIVCAGPVNPKTGMLVTYEDMLEALDSAIEPLDHQLLNDAAPEMGAPTTENLCVWFWKSLHRLGLNRLAEVKVQESENTSCTFRG